MKKYFFSGLVLLLPFALTFLIVKWIIILFTKPYIGFVEEFLITHRFFKESHVFISAEAWTLFISRLIVLFFLVGLIFLIGFLARWLYVHYLLEKFEYFVNRIPLINSIYSACKEVVHSFLSDQIESFNQVVMTSFPGNHTGLVFGFITSDHQNEIDGRISVFFPASPNPTMGFLLMVKKENLIYVDIPVEEALRIVISCGTVIS